MREACDRHAGGAGPAARRARESRNAAQPPAARGVLRPARACSTLFRRGGAISFDRDRLDGFADRHPAIALIRAARRVLDLQADALLTGELAAPTAASTPSTASSGRTPGGRPAAGRTCLGLGKVFRPLIVPEPGRGLGEADWSQIEVGVAAAVYGDDGAGRECSTPATSTRPWPRTSTATGCARRTGACRASQFKARHRTCGTG